MLFFKRMFFYLCQNYFYADMNKCFVLSLSLFFAIIIFSSCQQNKESAEKVSSDVVDIPATASGSSIDNSELPVFSFNEELHDFGKITQGEKVSCTFQFKNTGGSDLVISSAKGSCGCTVPDYPKLPVKSGEEGVINVVFNSEGKSGKVQKTVTIVSNANPNTKVLTIAAEIIVPEEK